MKQVGRVEIPQEAFLAVLKGGELDGTLVYHAAHVEPRGRSAHDGGPKPGLRGDRSRPSASTPRRSPSRCCWRSSSAPSSSRRSRSRPGSMLPTLQIGDHILVNKFLYGTRLEVPLTQMSLGQLPGSAARVRAT